MLIFKAFLVGLPDKNPDGRRIHHRRVIKLRPIHDSLDSPGIRPYLVREIQSLRSAFPVPHIDRRISQNAAIAHSNRIRTFFQDIHLQIRGPVIRLLFIVFRHHFGIQAGLARLGRNPFEHIGLIVARCQAFSLDASQRFRLAVLHQVYNVTILRLRTRIGHRYRISVFHPYRGLGFPLQHIHRDASLRLGADAHIVNLADPLSPIGRSSLNAYNAGLPCMIRKDKLTFCQSAEASCSMPLPGCRTQIGVYTVP